MENTFPAYVVRSQEQGGVKAAVEQLKRRSAEWRCDCASTVLQCQL